MKFLILLTFLHCLSLTLNAEKTNDSNQILNQSGIIVTNNGDSISGANHVKVNKTILEHNTNLNDNESSPASECHFCFNDFFSNLITTIIGALIAFYVALGIFKKERKHEAERNLEEQAERFLKTMKYCELLVRNIIRHTTNQSLKYKEFAESLSSNPNEKHILQIISNFDIQRIKDVNSNDFYFAYEHFNNEQPNYLENFKNINYGIDHLSEIMNQANEVFKTYINTISEHELNLKHLIEELSDKLFLHIKHIKTTYPVNYKESNEYVFLNNHLVKFHELNRNDSLLKDYVHDFVYILKGELIDFPNAFFFNDLFLHAKKIVLMANDYIHDSNEFSAFFNQRFEKIRDANEILDQLKDTLIINGTQHAV